METREGRETDRQTDRETVDRTDRTRKDEWQSDGCRPRSDVTVVLYDGFATSACVLFSIACSYSVAAAVVSFIPIFVVVASDQYKCCDCFFPTC